MLPRRRRSRADEHRRRELAEYYASQPTPKTGIRVHDGPVLEWARHRDLCELCNRRRPTEPMHAHTRGSGASDLPGNVLAGCRECHDRTQDAGYKGIIEVLTAIAMRDWPRVLAEIEDWRRRLAPGNSPASSAPPSPPAPTR